MAVVRRGVGPVGMGSSEDYSRRADKRTRRRVLLAHEKRAPRTIAGALGFCGKTVGL
jgi:hypothetical protein